MADPLSATDPLGLLGRGGGGAGRSVWGKGGPVTARDAEIDCSEQQYSVGVGLFAGGSPVGVGFLGGGGVTIGFTSNGAVFVQFSGTGSVGFGMFAGVGVQAGVGSTAGATPSGLSVSHQAQADFNYGAGATIGGTVAASSDGAGAQGPMPEAGRFGVGAGLQASIGITQQATIASPAFFPRKNCQCR